MPPSVQLCQSAKIAAARPGSVGCGSRPGGSTARTAVGVGPVLDHHQVADVVPGRARHQRGAAAGGERERVALEHRISLWHQRDAPEEKYWKRRGVRYSSPARRPWRRAMKRVRIEHDGTPAWGQLRDGEIVLDSGAALDPATVTLARARRALQDPRRPPHVPLAPRRLRRAPAARAVVLHEAAVVAERPPGRDPAAARRALPQLRGRAGRDRRQAHERGARAGRARPRVRLRARQRRRPARLPARRPRLDAARQGTGRLPADRPRAS